MRLKELFGNWTRVASILLFGGAIAWIIKLAVIVFTNGQVIDTGAAALFMKIGLLLILIGSTGIGNRISTNRALILRIVAIIISPVILFSLILLIGFFTGPLFKSSYIWYAEQEAPILIAVFVSMLVSYILFKSYKPVRSSYKKYEA